MKKCVEWIDLGAMSTIAAESPHIQGHNTGIEYKFEDCSDGSRIRNTKWHSRGDVDEAFPVRAVEGVIVQLFSISDWYPVILRAYFHDEIVFE